MGWAVCIRGVVIGFSLSVPSLASVSSLDIIEIKDEVSEFSESISKLGMKTHFKNAFISVTDEKSRLFIMQKFDKHHDLPFKYPQYFRFKSNNSSSKHMM